MKITEIIAKLSNKYPTLSFHPCQGGEDTVRCKTGRVVVICPIHGERTAPTNSLLYRSDVGGCPGCVAAARRSKKREQVHRRKAAEIPALISRLSNIYSEREKSLDFSALVIVTPDPSNQYGKSAIFKCREHGELKDGLSHLLSGDFSCPLCARAKSPETCKETRKWKEWVAKATELYGDRFTYEKTRLLSKTSKVIVTCRKHGDIEVRADVFVSTAASKVEKGHKRVGCFECASEVRNEKRISGGYARIVDSLRTSHPELRLLTSREDYRGAKAQLLLECRKHGEFSVLPVTLHSAQFSGCPFCSGKYYCPDDLQKLLDALAAGPPRLKLFAFHTSKRPLIMKCSVCGAERENFVHNLNPEYKLFCPSCCSADPGYKNEVMEALGTSDLLEPHTLYVLELITAKGPVYKIGVSKFGGSIRLNGIGVVQRLVRDAKVLCEIRMENKFFAYAEEQRLLYLLRSYRYEGPALAANGNTEMVEINPLPFLTDKTRPISVHGPR